MDKCQKHDEVMDRMFEKINASENKLTSIETKMDHVIAFKDMIHKAVYGNGQPGIKGKLDALMRASTMQWFLIGLLLVAVVGGMAKHLLGL